MPMGPSAAEPSAEFITRANAFIPAILFVAACGQSREDELRDAANQSDPAAAAILAAVRRNSKG